MIKQQQNEASESTEFEFGDDLVDLGYQEVDLPVFYEEADYQRLLYEQATGDMNILTGNQGYNSQAEVGVAYQNEDVWFDPHDANNYSNGYSLPLRQYAFGGPIDITGLDPLHNDLPRLDSSWGNMSSTAKLPYTSSQLAQITPPDAQDSQEQLRIAVNKEPSMPVGQQTKFPLTPPPSLPVTTNTKTFLTSPEHDDQSKICKAPRVPRPPRGMATPKYYKKMIDDPYLAAARLNRDLGYREDNTPKSHWAYVPGHPPIMRTYEVSPPTAPNKQYQFRVLQPYMDTVTHKKNGEWVQVDEVGFTEDVLEEQPGPMTVNIDTRLMEESRVYSPFGNKDNLAINEECGTFHKINMRMPNAWKRDNTNTAKTRELAPTKP